MDRRDWFVPTITVSIVILLFSLTFVPIPCNAEEVWRDNFDGPDNWSVFGMNLTSLNAYLLPGEFSIGEGVLRAEGPEWNYAGHNSSVAYGTWSFDVDIQVPAQAYSYQPRFSVVFISEEYDSGWLDRKDIGDGYVLMFEPEEESSGGDIALYMSVSEPGPKTPLGMWEATNLRGWKHIVVTRDTAGEFNVYVDGVLRITDTDTTHSTSEKFYFISPEGPAIDNVVVSDTVDPPTADNTLLLVAGVVAGGVLLVVIAIVVKRR